MSNIGLSLCVLITTFASALGDYCTKRRYGLVYYDIYCPYGCCGTYYNEYCCLSDTGVIIGIVVGGVAFLACIVTLIYCCVRHKSRRPRVLATTTTAQYSAGQAGVSTVTVGGQSQYPQWGYNPTAPQYGYDYNNKGANFSGPPPYPGTGAPGTAQPPQPGQPPQPQQPQQPPYYN